MKTLRLNLIKVSNIYDSANQSPYKSIHLILMLFLDTFDYCPSLRFIYILVLLTQKEVNVHVYKSFNEVGNVTYPHLSTP